MDIEPDLTSSTIPTNAHLTEDEFAAILASMVIPGSVPIPPDTDIRELAYKE